jgi:hypothetical protein
METTLRQATPNALRSAAARAQAPERTSAADGQEKGREVAAPQAPRAAPLKRGLATVGSQLQLDVARAQEAIDYLDRTAGQLEALKGQLAAKLAGTRSDERKLEARARELVTSLAARRQGGGVDANLDFDGAPAAQRFHIRELDIDSLQQGAPQTLAFSIGGAGGPQLSATIEPGMSGKQIAATIDRTLAPLKVRVQLDQRGELLFSVGEKEFAAVRDSIAVSGRGRVAAEPVAPAIDAKRLGAELDTSNSDAVRQSLREVVQALARVHRAHDAASAALSAAGARADQAGAAVGAAEANQQAQAFVQAAADPSYGALIAVSSALVGVSRERVLALLSPPR